MVNAYSNADLSLAFFGPSGQGADLPLKSALYFLVLHKCIILYLLSTSSYPGRFFGTTFYFLESRKFSHYFYFLKSSIFGMYFYFLESSSHVLLTPLVPKAAYFRVVLRRRISANIFGTKHTSDKREKVLYYHDRYVPLFPNIW